MPLKSLMFFFLASLIGILTALVLCISPYASRIAIVDMQRLLNQPAVLLSHSALPKEQQQKLLKRYAALLPKALTDFGKSHRVTLISATVLATGALDVTDALIQTTLDELNHD